MTEIITTLENLKDVQRLAESGANELLIALDGISSTAASKYSLDELKEIAKAVKAANAELANATDAAKADVAGKGAGKGAGKNTQVKIAIRANLTLHEGMLPEAEKILAAISELDKEYVEATAETDSTVDSADGKSTGIISSIFFADPSIYMLAKKIDQENGIEPGSESDQAGKTSMTSKLIYDPEMLMTSINDANWWLDRGIRGISISPILTLQETKEIAEATKKAVVTVHGRTLMSRSFRKLLSSYKEVSEEDPDFVNPPEAQVEAASQAIVAEETQAKAASASDAEAASTPAKKDWQAVGNKNLTLIEKSRSAKMPVYEDETGTLIYSDDVLDSFNFIDELLKASPFALLVEGSFADIEMQAEAVKAYSRILAGEDAKTIGAEYQEKFREEPFDSGYYEQKTVK